MDHKRCGAKGLKIFIKTTIDNKEFDAIKSMYKKNNTIDRKKHIAVENPSKIHINLEGAQSTARVVHGVEE